MRRIDASRSLDQRFPTLTLHVNLMAVRITISMYFLHQPLFSYLSNSFDYTSLARNAAGQGSIDEVTELGC